MSNASQEEMSGKELADASEAAFPVTVSLRTEGSRSTEKSALAMIVALLGAEKIGVARREANSVTAQPMPLDNIPNLYLSIEALVRGFATCVPTRFVVLVGEGAERFGALGMFRSESATQDGDSQRNSLGVILFSERAYAKVRSQPELGFGTASSGTSGVQKYAGEWFQLVLQVPESVPYPELPNRPPVPSVRAGLMEWLTVWALKTLDVHRLWYTASAVMVLVALGCALKLHHATPAAVRPVPLARAAVLSTHPVSSRGVLGSVPGVEAVSRVPPVKSASKGLTSSATKAAEPTAAKPPETKDPNQVDTPNEAPRPGHGGMSYSAWEVRALVNRADQLAGNGQYDEAIRFYKYALRTEPKDAEAHRGLARAELNRAEKR